MSKDQYMRYYGSPLLVLSVLAMPAFAVYEYYIGFNVWLLFSAPVFFLMSFLPWVTIEVFGLLEWEST